MTTTVNVVVEEGTGVGVDTVAYSSVVGETYPLVCSETTESSTATGEQDTRVHAPSVDVSAENADCKRGAQFPSPVSVESAEKTHTGTLTECGYSVEATSGTSYAVEQVKRGRDTGALLNQFIIGNLTRKTRRADDSLTTLHHIQTEMEKKQSSNSNNNTSSRATKAAEQQ